MANTSSKVIFKDKKGQELLIKANKSAIIFELTDSNLTGFNFHFIFDDKTFKDLKKHLNDVAKKSFTNFEAKEATSEASDYWEYYDSKFDNNGYLTIEKNGFKLERPSDEDNRLYKFNKRRYESFIHDLNKSK